VHNRFVAPSRRESGLFCFLEVKKPQRRRGAEFDLIYFLCGSVTLWQKLKFMSEHHGFMKALKCRECGREYPLEATHVCEFDFGPLEVAYDYDRIKKSLTKAAIESRPKTMWRYRELLPIAGEPTVGSARVSRRWSRPTDWRKRSASANFTSRTTR
jgi:hypothetical protein